MGVGGIWGASLAAQLVKNPPAIQETPGFYPWEDPLEEDMAIPSSILAWRIPIDRSLADYSPWSCKELDTTKHSTGGVWELCAFCSVLL